MQGIFDEYAAFGTHKSGGGPGTLESRQFIKFCQDNQWIDDASFPKSAADLVWTKVMRKERKMNFEQFLKAVDEIAARKKISPEELTSKIITVHPSKNNVTEFADDAWVKRQTDHNLYTGAHKLKFDPKTGKGLGLAGRVDTKVTDLADVANRGQYDIRGRNIEILKKQEAEKPDAAAD